MSVDAQQRGKDPKDSIIRMDRLCNLSREKSYDHYELFDWPETVDEKSFLMSPQLLSVAETSFVDELSHEQMVRLSHFEQYNYSSLNTHGERELIIDVIDRMHTPKYEIFTEYMHHLVEEENAHLWFFAQFCKRYGVLYQPKKIVMPSSFPDDVNDFLVFARLMIFEEIVVYFNKVMSTDPCLPKIVRDINRTHFVDESRHIAFGRDIVGVLYHCINFSSHGDEKELRMNISNYIKAYINGMLRLFYPLHAYTDAGIPDPYEFRSKLMKSPQRHGFHQKIVSKQVSFFQKRDILLEESLNTGETIGVL
ncbi:MAG: diiron oxygenase [Sulfitobacter sp.]